VEGRGYGLMIFASVVLAVVGFFNLFFGIAAVSCPAPNATACSGSFVTRSIR
jgi:hypothetical protein